MRKISFSSIWLQIAMIAFLLATGSASAGPQETKLTQVSSGNVRLTYKENKSTVSFIIIDNKGAIPQPYNGIASTNAEEAAINFLSEYANLFGRNYQPEYSLIKDNQTEGRHSVKLRQTVQEIPVFAGEMVVRMNSSLQVTGVNGEIASNLNDFIVKPRIAKTEAANLAIASVAKKNQVGASTLLVLEDKEPSLWVYNPSLINTGQDENKLVWRIEVVNSTASIRELIMVDAKTGIVVLDINQIKHVKNRNIHDLNNTIGALPGPLVLSEGGSTMSLHQDAIDAYNYSGDTYDFYMLHHQRDSLDNAGMTLVSTVRLCVSGESCPYANAFWDGSQMAYGEGFSAADDVVGHELTHGVTDFTSDLVYANQSGAINESFSDVWGEFIDLTNSGGDDTAAVRWKMGEDVPNFGAIRDMAHPEAFGDPDKISSSNYYCGAADQGGVHTNSGVNNKAAYLMVDGDTFNGKTVAGIGIIKTAKIYYEAQTNILTSGTSYLDLYNALQTACSTLVGSDGITSANCDSVKDAIDAVEMNTVPCVITPAPVCPVGETANNIFNDDLEGGLGAWTHASITGADVWSLSTANPASGSNHIHGNDISSISDSYIKTTSAITLSANAYLRFEHDYSFESTFDGGVVEYSTDGGTTWIDAGSIIINNGYTGTVNNSYGNPLGGRLAFVNTTGTYTASRLDLEFLAGSNVQFRFRIGTDSSNGALGWDIDNIQVYTCDDAGGVPAAATLVSPSGTINDTTPTYIWNAVAGATQYQLYVNDTTGHIIDTWITATDAGCTSGTGTCSFTPTIPLAAGSGQWWIQTWNSSGYGPWSNSMSFTVGTGTAPVAATLVSPSGTISDTTPDFIWNAVAGVTYYKLYIDDSTGNVLNTWVTASEVGCSSGTGICSYPSSTLAAGSGQWWVQTWNSFGYGPWSNSMSFFVGTGSEPGAATLVSPSGAINDTTPIYTWNAVAGASYYKLYVNDATGTVIDVWITAADAGCSSGTGTCSSNPSTVLATGNGQWWIQTWNPSGYGPWSNAMNFNVAASGACAINDQFSGSSSVNWGQNSGVWTESGGYWSTGTELNNALYTSAYNGSTNCNGDIDVTVKMKRDSSTTTTSNSLVLRASGALSDEGYPTAYYFQYISVGQYSVYKVINGEDVAIQPWTASNAIIQGSAFNKLRVVLNASSMMFYINDALVWTGSDTAITTGKLAVAMFDLSGAGDKLWVDYVTAVAPTLNASQSISATQHAANMAANLSPKGSINSVND